MDDGEADATAPGSSAASASSSRRASSATTVYAFRLHHWQQVEPEPPTGASDWIERHLPKPRSGHRIVYHRGGLYSFGGYNPNVAVSDPYMLNDPYWKQTRPLFKELWRFSVHTRRWRKLSLDRSSPVPDQLASHNLVMVGDRMLLYGGTGAPFGLTVTKDVFTMDMLLNRWEKLQLAEGYLPGGAGVGQDDGGPIPGPPPPLPQFGDDEWEDDDEPSDEEDEEGNGDEEDDEEAADDGNWIAHQQAAAQHDQHQQLQAAAAAAEEDGDSHENALPYEEPLALYGQAVTLHEGHLYTVGGTSGFHYYMDVHRLGLQTKKWQRLYRATGAVEEPSARYRHELCVWNGHLFVLGGGTSFVAEGFDRLMGFDLVQRRWRRFKTKGDPTVPIEESVSEQYPEPRRCHSAAQEGHFVYMMGGYDGESIFGDSWRLDLRDLSWRRLPSDPVTPVYFHAATITPAGKMYTFGGVSRIEDNRRTNAVQSCWIRIPSLRDMAFEALNHYVPDLVGNRGKVDQLLRAGVPRDLINEVNGVADAAG